MKKPPLFQQFLAGKNKKYIHDCMIVMTFYIFFFTWFFEYFPEKRMVPPKTRVVPTQ